MIAGLANTLWGLASLPEALRFYRAASRVEATQRNRLARIIKQNQNTDFGKRHGFETIRTVEEFQNRVPVGEWEAFSPFIARMARGESDVLVSGKPARFEPTSGSTSASKLIPYSKALQAEYQAGIAPWIWDLLRHCPRALRGRAYWSISPASFKERLTEGGIPIGFEDDTEYLAAWLRPLVNGAIAVPSLVSRLENIENFRYVTLAFLLAAKDLSLISVWNPTFLTLLLEPLREWAFPLCKDLHAGKLTPPHSLSPDLQQALEARLGRHPKRALELTRIFSGSYDQQALYQVLWPHLALISCWMDASAKAPATALQQIFPNVRVAPKGLLATEGVISLPLLNQGSALSLRSHFFEFVGDDGLPLPAWKLKQDECYEVLLTTGGGLYRYRLGDRVRVTGFYKQCPCLRFIGRQQVSDFYGEKLNEAHVAGVIEKLFAHPPGFALLAPEGDPPSHYVLYLAGEAPPEDLSGLSEKLERSLCENVHYAYCQTLGQLKPARVQWIGEKEKAFRLYHEASLARGQKAGDIKPTFLAKTSWQGVFNTL